MTTIGKYRHLTRCTTPDGHFVILAIDHRTNLLEKLNQYAPHDDTQFTQFKQQVIKGLLPDASALLTDPAYGLGVGIAQRTIRGGLLSPIEVTDYGLHPGKRDINFIPNWSVRKIKLMGGDGVKLLLPYHPQADNAAQKQAVVQQIVADCTQYDIPFFLEPIAYSLDFDKPMTNEELLAVCVETAQTFSDMGVDVLKMEFPLDVKQNPDEHDWLEACKALNAACKVPWALLSAGVDYTTFARQARIACEAGASGVIVGRAVWAEAVELQGEDRQYFIQTTAHVRMAELAHICKANAKPWFDRVASPEVGMNWYMQYLEEN